MKRLILIACAGLSISCTSIRILPNEKKPVPKTTQPQRVIKIEKLSRNSTADAYIEQYKDIAIEEMIKTGIPASITLAQGLLESANGNSTLAVEANNHFGIKCNTDWTGPTILKDDDALGECFRVYTSPQESYRDHSEFLKRKRYASLFELDRDDYRGWAQGLKRAGYATNPKYADLLINLVERYELDQYDRAETYIAKTKREDRVLTEIVKEEPLKELKEPEKVPLAMKIYEVKQGDTLFSISRRFGLSVDEVKILNSIQGNDLKLGQLLLVSK